MREILHTLRLKMLLLLTVVYLTVGLAGGLIFYWLFTEYYFSLYFAIVLFYWFMGIITNYMLDHARNGKSDRLLSVFMVSRMIKFLLTIVFLAVFELLLLEERHKMAFAFVLMTNFVLYTSLELYIYYLYNKRNAKNAKKE